MVNVPNFVTEILQSKIPQLVLGKSKTRYESEPKRSIDSLPPLLLNSMYSFQRQGVEFGLQKYGRMLLGDEMGVGKTI